MDWLNNDVTQFQNWNLAYHQNTGFSGHFFDAPQQLPGNLHAQLHNTHTALKHDRTTTVQCIDNNNQSLILKRYNARNTWHAINRALRGSRAQRCWRMSYKFQAAGLNVAEPILMCEQRFGPLRLSAFFISRKLVGQELLSLLPKMTGIERAQVKLAVQSAFDIMRTCKLSHGDMKASNLLWVDGELFFIDLDAAREHQSASGWERANSKDKKRFLKNWRNHPELLALFNDLT